MRLIQAHIRGFGRLVDRRLPFQRDMQILVGSNEAGKSTLQQFLLAALFGLKREGRKRRDYMPQYERYKPWDGAPYAGSLTYELSNGEQWEVQRVFDRDGESLQLYDALTGEERTELYPMDSRKERNFMLEQLHLTRHLFEATTSLGQLAGQPSEEGVGVFRERIQGLLDSGDEDVSARRALSALQGLREQFGSERTPSRGRGLLMQRKKDLEAERDEAVERHAEILDLYARRNQVIAAHQQAEESWRRSRNVELGRQQRRLQQRLLRAEALEQQVEETRQQLAVFDDVAQLDPNDYTRAREQAAAVEAQEEALRPYEVELHQLQERLEDLQAFQDTLVHTLGAMDRPQRQRVEREAERLREAMGRYREARRRNLEEQEVNKRVVEQLTRHHGRDWTRDDFMARLATEVTSQDAARIQPLRETTGRAVQAYAQARRALTLRVGAASALVLLLTAIMLWSPGPLPLAARIVAPLLAAGLLVAYVPTALRRFLGQRDELRALQSQLAHVKQHVQEARLWVQEALERNGVQRVEDLHEAHREYIGLVAASQESPETAAFKERLESEEALRLEAQQLRQAVAGCDFEALRRLLEKQDSAAYEFLPFSEDATIAITDDDSQELARLAEDLRLLPELRRGFDWCDRLWEEAQRVEERLDEERQALHGRREGVEAQRRRLQEMLEAHGVADLAAFEERITRRRERQAVHTTLAQLQSEVQGVLNGESMAALRQRVDELRQEIGQVAQRGGDVVQGELPWPQEDDSSEAMVTEAVPEESRSLEELGHEVEQLAAERAQLEERLTARERQGRTPAEVQLEIDEVELQIHMEQRRDDALVLAMETLERVSSQLHREVAPQMNARVGEFFQRLSLGKHEEVHLDETLTPRIRSEGGAFREVESLSGGAADQLYFAVRVTAGEQLARSGEHLPLLLDDPFVQYDPDRMRAAMDVVTELAVDHQVFFFTCEEAQARALQERAEGRGLATGLHHL